jgi:uncharacterized membrane protein YccC
MIGLVVAAVLLGLDLPAWLVLLLIAGLQAMVELLVVRNYGLALLFVTPLALLSVQLADPLPVRELSPTVRGDPDRSHDRRAGGDPDP